jgi:hypothetical protein
MLKHRLSSRLAARLGADQGDGRFARQARKSKILAVSSMSSKARRRKSAVSFLYGFSGRFYLHFICFPHATPLSFDTRVSRSFAKRLALCIESAEILFAVVRGFVNKAANNS